MKNRSGVVDPVTLSLVALVALGAGVFGTSWKPLDIFRKKPPTEELTKLQSDLANAQAAADEARKAKDAAVHAERAKLEQEVRSAQGDNLGAVTALGRVPPQHKTSEVKLALSMANRVSMKLAASIGKLPQDQQDAMVLLIEQALSDKQSEVDEANRKLALRDADFATLKAEKDTLAAQIPVWEQRAVKAEETAKATQAQVTGKTNEVKAKADELDAEKRHSGSLGAALDKTFHWILGAVGLWFFLAYILPGLVKHMDGDNPMKAVLRNIAGYATSPLLFHDARAKLNKPEV